MKNLVYKTSEEKFLKCRELLLVNARIFDPRAESTDNILCEEIHEEHGICKPVGLIYSGEDMMNVFRSDVIVRYVYGDIYTPVYTDVYYRPIHTETQIAGDDRIRVITFHSPLSDITANEGRYLDIIDDIIAAGPR